MIKYCAECEAIIPRISKQWLNKIYCSTKCRKNSNRKKKSAETRIQQRRSNLVQNDEMLYLVRQCKKAKTVQILRSHDLKSFIETMRLIRERPPGKVDLCHVAPVKGRFSTGLIHCRNLFYAGSHQNRKFGQKYIAGGLSIPNRSLQEKWKVTDEMSNNDILKKIELYLKDIIQDYIKSCPVRKSKKVQLANKIAGLDESKSIDELMLTSYKGLVEQWRKVSDIRLPIPAVTVESKYLVYMDSLTRFLSYDEDRKVLIEELRCLMVVGYMALERVKKSKTYNKYFYVKYEPLISLRYGQAMLKNPEQWSVFKDLIYDFAFLVLQGGSPDIKGFRKLIFSYLWFPKKAWVVS
ncbi:hypothetical protein [Pseudomonas sp. JAI120]|uniref:hypothetical protein n=1 Tax=Pseudomonas sp. JAI120 TaxID=2723063 RepID=UPI0030D89911